MTQTARAMPRPIVIQAAGFALANANAHIHEHGGNNMGVQIQAWQKLGGGDPGESWCQFFALAMYVKAWCAAKGLLNGKTDADNQAIMLQHVNAFSATTHIPRTGSCQASYDAAQVLYRTRSQEYHALPGDQVFYDFPVGGSKLGHAHHTGIVLESLADGTIKTVEGNTKGSSAGSQSDGDGCFVRVRSREFVYGFASYGF